ncbi:MAG: ABC-ATPase UvrA [Planctomycetota bacterium]
MSRLPDIVCRGAREHNLRDLDVRIPGGSLVAFTGVSGSGKSSLAFDVIAREGRRRYLQTLSALARRRVGAERPPAVDAVEGLTATIALEQADPGRSPRSTVGTASGVAGYLRSLWTFAGVVHCAQCDSPVSEGSIAQVVPSILDWAADRRTILLAPIWKGRRGNLAEQLRDLQERGFVRVRLDGEVKRLDEVKFPAGRHQRHDLDVVVDRLRVDGSKASRVREAVERGTALSEGLVTVMLEDGTERTFGTERVCLSCGVAWPRPVPAWFSFNDSLGACERCRGTGEIEEAPCPDCDGERLRPLSRQVRFEGLRLPEAQRLPLDQLTRWIEEHMDPEDPDRHELLRGAHERLRCLLDLALGYVSLERRTGTLSRGELQRVRLAAVLGAGLHGVTYVLDEPAVGLHAVDRLRLSRHLRGLRDRGNNVLFVEHDLDLIRAADHVIDLGPGAGAAGGRLLVQGTPSEVAAESASPTGRALSEGPLRVEPIASDEDPPAPVLRIVGAREHNLKDIDVAIPLGRLVALTGVSGSGKSTLTESILYPALASRLQKAKLPAGEHERLEGAAELVRVEHVTARSLGRSPRSCPATIVKAFDEIRALFALLPEARARGWTARRFSLNVAGGRCEACKGTGFRSVRLEPLPPVEVTCSNCDGRRYERSMLDLRFKGKTIAEVLDLSVDEARELFLNQPKIHRALQALSKVGLGYLRLGQPLPRLSGGEAQRLKLAAEMRRRRQGKTLFILDEPTRGLHAFDIERLLACWRELVDRGDTVLVVEHHLSVVARADWVIDLGPGPGEAGGQIVACGPPAAIAASEASVTGAALRGELSPEAAERRGHEDPAEEPVRIECARARNLKSLSLEIPNGKIIQVKGPLGSGKTALVSETIAAEARRVFLSALASGGWGGLEGATRPDVRSVSGLRPVLVLEEPGSAGRARGTVATACGLDRPLRELFARCGVLHCPECGLVARGESPDQAASRMLEEHTGRADVLAPLWWPQSGRTTAITDPARVEDALEWCRQNGLTRIVANDDVLRIDRDDIPSPLPDETFLLLDRLELTEAKRGRLREAIETAFDLASGLAIVVT